MPANRTLRLVHADVEPIHPASVLVEFGGKVMRVAFYTNDEWARLGPGERPGQSCASDDESGYFAFTEA